MELGLKDKKVLLVGASKGIGRSIALGFAEEGSQIVSIARTESLLQSLKIEALKKGASSFDTVKQDIMECETKEFAKSLMDKYGVFDVVVHNVGGSLVSRDYLAGEDDWYYALKFNAIAAININHILIPPMIKNSLDELYIFHPYRLQCSEGTLYMHQQKLF